MYPRIQIVQENNVIFNVWKFFKYFVVGNKATLLSFCKKIVYSGDTLINSNMKKLAQDADVLIHDATFLEKDREKGQKHASIEEVLQLASEINVKQIILTHISRRYQDTSELKDVIKDYPNAKIAKDFMKITLP